MTNKSEQAYKTIGEVAEILELKSKNKGVFSTHTIRFWETQFKQVKPKLLNSNRRYYDQKTIDILKKIKFLLKDQGMTINGVKKILDNPNNKDTLNKRNIVIEGFSFAPSESKRDYMFELNTIITTLKLVN